MSEWEWRKQEWEWEAVEYGDKTSVYDGTGGCVAFVEQSEHGEATALERAQLIAAAPRLRDALRAVITAMPWQWDWCQHYDYEPSAFESCGKCPGCRAWQAAHDALAISGLKEANDA